MADAAAVVDAKLDSYTSAQTFPSPVSLEVSEAVRLIRRCVRPNQSAQALQLLALRRYIRLGSLRVQTNWAWTAEQAAALIRQGAAKVLIDEAAKVQANFAKANPGYALALSPIRSLERQVRLWNGNNSVQHAANGLRDDVLEDLEDAQMYPDSPTVNSVSSFVSMLRHSTVTPEPTSAAPGTSDHGQMRAVDFVVVRSFGKVVAGTISSTIATVWKLGGWEAKLTAAAAGTKLTGPLKHPYEPWHWRLAR
jgi:hypothetical protein